MRPMQTQGESSINPDRGSFAFYKAFRHVETLFIQGGNLVPSRPVIGWRKVNKPANQKQACLLQGFYLG